MQLKGADEVESREGRVLVDGLPVLDAAAASVFAEAMNEENEDQADEEDSICGER